MHYLAGVDEAGLGPILGPLVVGGVSMAGPEGVSPWRVLQRHVTKQGYKKGKIRVADSKKVKSGPHGFQRLEETALVLWAAWTGTLPNTLGEWLQTLGHDLEPLARCPWYQDLDLPLPQAADRDWILLTGEMVARALARADCALFDISARAVDVEEWNGLIAATDNKSRAHFHAYSIVLQRLVAGLMPRIDDGDAAHLVADRCGGRAHYRNELQKLFPDAAVSIHEERPGRSSYRIRSGGAGACNSTPPVRELMLTFAERAEERAFPTALASCCAKYLRELMVATINRWFAVRIPGLRPTAGYYVDGHRFLVDVEPQIAALDLPRERLIRVR
ncbi:MAG: hypothetical protein AB8H80_12835 [Planctomycetota bacterium]